ncbi:MAG: hypothetical protein J6A95_05480 [Clostridia bacterium]|nr:hypothetical protein [Clostridia bacterium]
MKYITPKYEVSIIETEDILTASSGQNEKYEVTQNADGSGDILMEISKLFG